MASRCWTVAAALSLVALLGCGADESSFATGGGGSGNSGATTSSGGSGASAGTGTGGTGGQATGGSGGVTPTSVKLAVIGDYGDDSDPEAAVAQLVTSWVPDLVVTAGDNNYPDGAADTIDANIGKHYQAFIGNYQGTYGPGSATNRFFPSPGNHDWVATDLQPYLDYFTLPGNERYYDVDFGLVHLFMIDSVEDDPDGADETSTQGQWAQAAITGSNSCWDVVVFHYAAYSSCSSHGSIDSMQWPFEDWGADTVINGHDHTYERLQVGNIPYFVNGIGGAGLYGFGTPVAESQFRYNDRHGAMLVTATTSEMKLELYSDDGVLQDEHTVAKSCN
jgi:tartrate-resistant acid phosphatase type 5